MQERRYRPGDVLDDYCPRERRITDHAIVAMIDNEIQKTRCGSCDAEHEYKEGKVPAPRRKTQPPALFTQVLDGLQGPTARPPAPAVSDTPEIHDEPIVSATSTGAADEPAQRPMAAASESAPENPPENADDDREEGPIRRSLIRATFPKVEGQVPIPRAMPEFTIQSLNNRNNRPGGSRPGGGKNNRRRRPGGGGGSQDHIGPMRFREHNGGTGGQGSQGGGRGFGQGDQRPQGQGPGQGQGGRRRRRGGGGKKTG
jgi:hypothetical protein